MGTMTITIDDGTEAVFRKRVAERFGKGKGVLGKAATEAIETWVGKDQNLARCMEILEKGVDLGKITYTTRDELHDRD